MGALFGFPEQSDMLSMAVMVSSKWWPLISSYGASGLSNKVDDDIMKAALLDFYTSSGKMKPDQIIIFRDGVSASQFNQVLIKLLRLASSLTRSGTLKIVGSPDNVLHGTVINNKLHIWGQFMKIRDALETSSSHGGMYALRVISVPQLSRLKDKVSNFILVC
ncbi:hypothetical protein GOBAR_AA17526 [Gossypium barbadense]|uniref:Piwi domain-containing protein n=1 Tax=Gossypium barbadense TaxID=3634 RepID=A0A2P5XIF8_GOSBA|nr:hypothetical protein GOBAR_AA17526 [Gossypium barbadense]